MRKFFKRKALAIFLAMAMLISMLPMMAWADTAEYEYIWFGEYPQSRVESGYLSQEASGEYSFDYSGEANVKPFVTSPLGNGDGSTTYYSYDPIKWIILETVDNEDDTTTYTLLSESIIALHEYDDYYSSGWVYGSTWSDSSVREWLNSDARWDDTTSDEFHQNYPYFYGTAFGDFEKSLIVAQPTVNTFVGAATLNTANTSSAAVSGETDYVSFLSVDDCVGLERLYTTDFLIANITAYASQIEISFGATVGDPYKWLLNSVYANKNYCRPSYVDNTGDYSGTQADSTFNLDSGIRPVVTITVPTTYELTEDGTFDNPYVIAPAGYDVTFDFGAESGAASQTVSVAYGATVGAPQTPEYSGYSIEGWYTEATFKNAWDFTTDTVTKDITLYAKWQPAQYTVQFMTVTSEENFTYIQYGDPVYFSDGDKITLPEKNPALGDYAFGSWFTVVGNDIDGYKTEVVTDATVCTSDMTIYAAWGKINVDVNVDVNTGESTQDDELLAEMTAIEAFNAKQANPSDYFEWYTIDLTGTIISAETGSSGAVTVNKYEKSVYEITGPYGNLAPIGVLVDFDSTGKENFRVYRYHDEENSNAEILDGSVSAVTDGGNVTLFEEVYERQTPTNDAFYNFPIYQNSVASVFFSDEKLVNEDTETEGNVALYSGKFSTFAIGYDIIYITFNADEGTVTPEGAYVETDGTLSELPTPTRSGYTFAGWSTEDGEAITVDTVFKVSTSIYAQWTQNSSSSDSSSSITTTTTTTIVTTHINPQTGVQ